MPSEGIMTWREMISLSAFGAAHSGEPPIYYYRLPVSQMLTARCCAEGAQPNHDSHTPGIDLDYGSIVTLIM